MSETSILAILTLRI